MKKTSLLAILAAPLLVTGIDTEARTPGHTQQGVASYYHDSLHGLKTASGVRYNRNAMTAAHKTLPLGSRIRVTDARTGRSIVVKVNDRGPFVRGRIVDLSRQAANELGLIGKGIARVEVEVLSVPAARDS